MLGVFAILMLSLFVSAFASGLPRDLASGLLLGSLAAFIESILAIRIARGAIWRNRWAFLLFGVVFAVGAAYLSHRWVGLAAAIVAAPAAASLQLWLAIKVAIVLYQRRRLRAFEARLAAGATAAEVDALVEFASRQGADAMFASLDVLCRHRRLTRALDVLRRSRVTDRLNRADWLIHIHLALGDVALARELLEDVRRLLVTTSEVFVVLEARVRIAEGDATGVLDELVADPPGVAPETLVGRWAVRADALVTAGDPTRARAMLDRIREHDPTSLDRLAAGGRPCHVLAQEALTRDGAPFR